MATIYDVPANELIEKAAEKLKEIPEIKAPVWASYVKTGHSKERPPVREGWWYVRSAAVLRSVYRLGPIGVSKLRVKYGGRKNRGVVGERSYKGSGNILRKILQQLEKAELVKPTVKEVHKGRVITSKGKSLLDKASTEIYKNISKDRKQNIPKEIAEKEIEQKNLKKTKEAEQKKETKKPKETEKEIGQKKEVKEPKESKESKDKK